jgi:hypothetical protein
MRLSRSDQAEDDMRHVLRLFDHLGWADVEDLHTWCMSWTSEESR